MYLSNIQIENFRGISSLNVSFDPKINIIIGENGCSKTALIDALRLLYNLGNPKKDIYVSGADFFYDKNQKASRKNIEIGYTFRGLSDLEKGALYEYLVFPDAGGEEEPLAQITIRYEFRENVYPKFSYYTGRDREQKADPGTFEIFQHYYMGALRDSTHELLNSKANTLGRVIKRLVERSQSEETFRGIIKQANDELLRQPEVFNTKQGINDNLNNIFKIGNENGIGFRIEDASKLEGIVNVIKPYLPHDKTLLENDGLHLWQNSLGFNNLIYIAVILSDIKERLEDSHSQHFALFIEEPEAHLHPQLQLNLFNFLREASAPNNCQLFITSHSPTLTSKANLDNLILLKGLAINVGHCFKDRQKERIIEVAKAKKWMQEEDFVERKKQLERYLDVTKSQLFFAKSLLFVEGISEKLLIASFANFLGLNLDDHRCEMVSVDGTSFYSFIHLFNSSDESKRMPQKFSIITDDDRYSKARNSFRNLVKRNTLDAFHEGLIQAQISTRIANLKSTLKFNANWSALFTAFKTLEYEIAFANTGMNVKEFSENFLTKYLSKSNTLKIIDIYSCAHSLSQPEFTLEERQKLAILVWKALPSKTDFAQSFSYELEKSIGENHRIKFSVPAYITNAIKYSLGYEF